MIVFDYQSVCHCSKTKHRQRQLLSQFDYQSVCHCSKTLTCAALTCASFDYQSVCHCSKTVGAKSSLQEDGQADWRASS